jgi:hypothetical protein
LPLYAELAALSKSALKPNGILAVMTGQCYLPEILSSMSAHLPYRWTMAYLTPGQAARIWARNLTTFWKPVLLFGGRCEWLSDVVKSEGNDKRHHDWGQSESGMRDLPAPARLALSALS